MITSKEANQLLKNIKRNSSRLKRLLKEVNSHWGYEDYVYRFYHGSFKVYRLQHLTRAIAEELEALAPKYQFCPSFQKLLKRGAGYKRFKLSHNINFNKHTRIFLEAFFHAKYFLEMAVKYGKELKNAPNIMPSGWAALLTLFVKKSLDKN